MTRIGFFNRFMTGHGLRIKSPVRPLAGPSRYPCITEPMLLRAGWITGPEPTWGETVSISKEQLDLCVGQSFPADYLKNTAERDIARFVGADLALPYAYHIKAQGLLGSLVNGERVLEHKSLQERAGICAEILCWHDLAKMPPKAATLLFSLDPPVRGPILSAVAEHYSGKIEELISAAKGLQS